MNRPTKIRSLITSASAQLDEAMTLCGRRPRFATHLKDVQLQLDDLAHLAGGYHQPSKTRTKTFVVESQTNLGLMVHVVNATSKDQATELAKGNGAWPEANAYDVDTTKPGVVHTANPTG